MNIKTDDFAYCPPHLVWITGVAVFSLLLILKAAFSHPLADFFSVKGNQEYVKEAYSNWDICPANVTVSFRKYNFLEVFTKDVARNYRKKML